MVTGYDNTPEGPDFSLKCTMTVIRERVKLCQYYNDRRKQITAEATLSEKVKEYHRHFTLNNFIADVINYVVPQNIKEIEESIKRVCPRAKYDEQSLL